MLDQKVFLQGINYLKANYINWGFDINNELQVKVWYKKFSNLDASVFMGLVEKYTDVMKYAPNSPADLLDLLSTQLIQKEPNADDAWLLIKELMDKYWLSSDRVYIYKELETKPALYKTFKAYEFELNCYDSYTVANFKKSYEKNLKLEIEKKRSLLTGSNIYFLN